MDKQRLLTLCLCRWKEFRREPSAFFWVVLMPVFWMIVLGFTLNSPFQERYGVLVADQDIFEKSLNKDSPANISYHSLMEALQSEGHLKIHRLASSDVDRAMRRGEAALALFFNVTHDEHLMVRYRYSPTHPDGTRSMRFVNDLIQERLGRSDVLAIQEEILHLSAGRYVDFLIPGLLAMSVMTTSLFGIGMTMVSNRKENLLKRYLATPMRRSEFIFSHVVGRLIVFVYEFMAIMLAAYFIFGFTVRGNYLAFFGIAMLGAATFSAIALAIAARTMSLPAMAGIINLVTLPMMFFSGIFFSQSYFPEWVRKYASYLPLTQLVDALRAIALDGLSIGAVTTHVIVLAIFFFVASVWASFRFRWY